jgi:hypothetical protein
MDELLKELKNNNEKFSDEYSQLIKEYYEKMIKEGKGANFNKNKSNTPDEEGGLVITPEKFCTLKTTDVNGQKIFINITSHEKIDAPKEEHILEMQNQLGLRLPMSLSEKNEDFDNNGMICQVYDVIFNPSVLNKTENDPASWQLIFNIISERIRQRFNHNINQNFVKLKNMKYKGKHVKPQRVRVRKGPKIEEVLKQEEKFGPDIKEIDKSIQNKGKTPNWNLLILKNYESSNFNFIKKLVLNKDDMIKHKFSLKSFDNNTKSDSEFIYYDGTNANPKYGNCLLYLISMDLLSKSFAINLNICDEGIYLNCPQIYSLQINLPFGVNSQEAFSYFEKSSRMMFIYLPFYKKDCQDLGNKLFNLQGKDYLQNSSINGAKDEVIKTISEDYLYDLIV